jgi:hypothetical protein
LTDLIVAAADGGFNLGGSLEATRRSFNKGFLLALAADFKRHGPEAICPKHRKLHGRARPCRCFAL